MGRLPGPKLATERLILQTPRLRDVPALHRWCLDPAITRYMSWLPPQSPKDTLEFVQRSRAEQRRGEAVHYVLHERDTGRPIGCCGVHHVDRNTHRKAEFGYWVARPYWRRGFATEALGALLPFAFRELQLHRLYALVFVQNTRSARLLEQIGCQFEGTLRQHVRREARTFDVHQYSLLATDPAARRIMRAAA